MHRSLRIGALFALSLLLSACPAPRRPAQQPETQPAAGAAAVPSFPGAIAHRLLADESVVKLLVYRGGRLASAGHNHVIVSRNLGGTVWVHEDVTRGGFQILMPAALLEVDDPQMRTEEGADFPREVPESARQGTRKNMLSEALLDADRFPGVTLTSLAISGSRDSMQARTRIDFKDQSRELTIPVTASYEGGRVVATGEFAVKQSELGLTPFSVMLGAVTVQDEIKVKFRLVAAREKQGIATETHGRDTEEEWPRTRTKGTNEDEVSEWERRTRIPKGPSPSPDFHSRFVRVPPCVSVAKIPYFFPLISRYRASAP